MFPRGVFFGGVFPAGVFPGTGSGASVPTGQIFCLDAVDDNCVSRGSSTLDGVADLVQDVSPSRGQNCRIRYRVRTDCNLDTDRNIEDYTIRWLLFENPGDSVALLDKTGYITTPYATIAINATEMNSLTAGQEYFMQLWRDDTDNVYPLTGIGSFIPKASPAGLL